MSADWTTCRVVRDHDGDLWFRDRDAGWMNRWRDYYGADIWLDEDRGPLVPVLDADGVPLTEALAVRAERDALAAAVERVRDWLDHRGVDVSDRDGDYMDGYRAAQRHAVQDAAKLRRALDGES